MSFLRLRGMSYKNNKLETKNTLNSVWLNKHRQPLNINVIPFFVWGKKWKCGRKVRWYVPYPFELGTFENVLNIIHVDLAKTLACKISECVAGFRLVALFTPIRL